MRTEDIKKKLRPHRIHGRKSTLTTAFASAIAPRDDYEPDRVNRVIRDLRQNPSNLKRVFCGKPATSWDHLVPLIKDKKFSGYGHWLGNLVPCCTDCNALKRGVDWRDFLKSQDPSNFHAKKTLLLRHVEKYGRTKISSRKIERLCGAEMRHLDKLRDGIFDRMKEADRVASVIHERLQKSQGKSRR